MRNLFSRTRTVPRRSRATRARNINLENLEGRELLTTLSVVSASMNEIGDAGAFVASGSGGLSSPKDLTLGPDGNLYVTSPGTNSVLRFNGTTGQLIGTFVAPNSGGLVNPFGLAFGPDGNLFVAGAAGSNAVFRYNGATGAFLNTFVATGTGGLSKPIGLAFGPDGSLYASDGTTDSILRFQGPNGVSPGSPLPSAGQTGATFVAAGSGGLDNPFELTFGPDGDLYVASTLTNKAVLRFDGTDGGFVGTTVSPGEGGLDEPRGLAFDQDGRLYVADINTNSLHRYDSQGVYLDDPVGNVGTILRAPIGMTFDRQGALLVSSRDTNAVVRYDRGVVITMSAASAVPVSVAYATVDGSATGGTDFTSQSGTVTFAPGQTSRRILLATRDDLLSEGNETFNLQLSNPTGGVTIANGAGLVNIVDDESTRQITVNDSTTTEGSLAAHFRGGFVEGSPGAHFAPIAFGPDGNLYTAVGTGPGYNTVRRYDGTSGEFIDTFAAGGQINGVRDIVFRAGFMYVGSEYTDEVLRFDATTGAFVDVFVAAGSGGIGGPHGLTFGPDANGDAIPELYVSGRDSFNVVRYDGATGLPLGTYVTPGSGGLSWPEGLTFDPTGSYLLVASTGSSQVLKYNAQTGAYLGVGISSGLSGPKDVKFGPGRLIYVTSGANDRIPRYTAAGTYVDDYVPAGSGGLDNPSRLAFDADGDVYVTATGNSQVLRFGTESEMIFTVSLSTPSPFPLTVDFATSGISAETGSDFEATVGTITFLPGVTSRMIRVPILNDASGESTETFALNLTGAVGGAITDAQGIGTILDDDSTKFFVVDDATANRTYEYAAGGSSVENYALNSGNTAPRGAASTAAGTTVWVADANKKVYVYDAAGVGLGSWTAGSLASNATVEGIATNGTDVWVVDARQDRVYRYANAAGRRSGSQNAASSFALNSGNRDPKDVVTDGVHLWVVNDATADKVFQYTLAGSLVGSWTISGAGTSPTGITLDPTGGGTLWTVDSGTDQVYQFDNARSLTSGSLSPSTSFALASGNTNPQGIADPPVPTVGKPRIAASSGTSHPSGHLAAHHRRAYPGLSAAKPTSSFRRSVAAPPSILGQQATSLLLPSTSSTGQDLTSVDTERFQGGKKRSRITVRG